MPFIRSTLFIVALLAALPIVHAASGDKNLFSDLPTDHPATEAVRYLKERGIISGYSDGTFQSDQFVNRAEALKLIVAPISFKDQIRDENHSSYEDVSSAVWYFPYVERGFRSLGIIDGPPKTLRFYGERKVITAEFLKMLLLAYGVELSRFDHITLPLSHDVRDAEVWYYPYMRFALTASMLEADEYYALTPGKELTRADTAQLLYRFLRYKENRRAQSLLDQTEHEILTTLNLLEEGDTDEASYASTRALLTAEGALRLQPNVPLVTSVMKVAEGFAALVEAYSAGSAELWEEVITKSGDAWNAAGDAQYLHSDMKPIATEMMRLAKQMADEARETLGR